MTIDALVGLLRANPDFHSIVSFVPRKNTARVRIRVTRIGKFNRHGQDYRVTIGEPNYAEREFLKDCRKAGCHPKSWWGVYYPRKRK